ncbi:hypothetical protein [Desulfobacterium sp. N47]|uniref:YkgJ family cysteine cluster protein n=1 Tax=uncultured Desulfobacterium sp. TaxID=201089 RepID=E1YBC1_9BACT|nr:hypothetical protein N47_C18560 [uncultured Desulfobacterium sp.]
MNLNSKLLAFDKIFEIYKDFTDDINTACKKYCSICCTKDVIMTSVEGYKIIRHIISEDKTHLFEKIKASSALQRFKPEITINGLADLSMEEDDLPEEIKTPIGRCPLLVNNACSVYPDRPFACRCFISTENCEKNECAIIDDYVLTINNIFLQVIEHVDQDGFTGNLTDILLFLESAQNRENLLAGKCVNRPSCLINNRPLKILMIPPEHRDRVQPLLKALKDITY